MPRANDAEFEGGTLDAPTDTGALLAQRYGRTPHARARDRLLLILGGLAVGVIVVAWVFWAGLDGQRAAVEVTNTSYTINAADRSIEVRWNLSAPPGSATSCIVQALNANFTIVGWKVVDIPPSTAHIRTLTKHIRLAQPADTGLAYRCWLT
ncbi:MAG: hypothetical protein B5766_09070 [Candidatus Lumbricidophila eiseniae]|uniref:DUF4307 domain-containing protein n=1 Tax=Candidatus Lumbricidiphila eiseniae TaxID=1969409 RepID=A0A2A6FQ83_9MICO|nr:MAG: hypothetical protein B5766_09070 [Candidatus Lumbricidophila eiseniae]